jgi:signal transduction histidine kinase
MVLSISFSVIFYITSTDNLHIQLQPVTTSTTDPNGANQAPSAAGIDIGIGSMGGSTNPPVVTSTAISSINSQLQKRLTAILTDLLHRLIILNIGALILGGILSYYLARRTLQPIKAAMETQSRFTSDASHELRTPLTAMQSEIEVVLHKKNLSLERAKAALRSNYQEVMRLKQLSEGLLHLARTPQNMKAFSTVVILDEVVNEATNYVIKPAQVKHITVINTVPKLSVHGDAPSLAQALVILLDNAVKYSLPNRTIHIEARSEGKHIYLSVRDEGSGIRATDLPHIFDRFYRSDSSRSKQDVSGYGLGLSIAREIIKQHHGELTAASVLGEGSTFTIKLPA